MGLIWGGLAATIVYDYLHDNRITPFSILFLLALVAGYLLPKIFKWPVYTSHPSRYAIISLLFIFVVLLIINVIIRVFTTG